MLRIASLTNKLCAEIAKTACYLVNQLPFMAIGLKTHIEMYTEKPVDYFHLHAFKCLVIVMHNTKERTKLDSKCKRYIFLRYIDEGEISYVGSYYP